MNAYCTNAIWILLAGLLMSSFTITFHPGFAQGNTSNSSSVYNTTSHTFSKTTSYEFTTDRNSKIVVQFPAGWTGFANTAAPAGINVSGVPQSKEPFDNVTMIVLGGNTTNFGRFFGINGSNAISFGDFVNKNHGNCKSMTGLTDTFMNIGSIQGEKVIYQCGTQGETKDVVYLFATDGESIVMPYFSGSTLAVNHHLPKIEESIQKIQIEKPTSVKELISAIAKSN